MAGGYDGHLKFDTSVNGEGFQTGVASLAKGAAAGITAVAAALGAMATYAIKTGIEFESAFAGVKKTVDGTEEQITALHDAIIAMSKEIPQSAADLSAIAEAAGQLGIKTDNIADFTKVMANLGVATNMSADEAATSLARLANITQMPQTEFERLGSTIVALGNNLATTEGEITAMALRIAGAGNQVGMTEDQILSFSGALSSVGIEAEAGGTAFSTLISKMSLAAAQGGEDLANFASVAGMTGEEFKAAFEQDAAAAISTFIQGLSNISENGGSAIATLDEIGLSDIRMRDALLRAAGASDVFTEALQIGSDAWAENTALTNEAEQRYATMESRIQLLKNGVDALGIAFYESCDDKIGGAVDLATGYIQQLSDAFTEGGIDGLVEELGNVFADAATQIVAAAPALVAAATNAIKAFISGIRKNQSKILDAAIELGGALISGIAEILPELGAFGLELIMELATRLLDGLPQLTQMGVEMLNSLAEGIATGLPEFLASALPLAGDLAATIRESAGQLVDAGINLIMNLADGLIAALPDMLANIPQIIIDLCGVINDNAPKLLLAGIELIGKLVVGLVQAIPQILAAMPKIVEAIWSVISAFNWLDLGKNIMTFFSDGLKSMITNIQAAGKNIFDSVKNAIINLPATLKDLGSNAISFMSSGIRGMLSTIGNAAKSVFTNIVNAIINLPSRLLNLAKDAVGNVVTAFKSIEWGSIGANIINGIISGIGSAVAGLVSSAVDAALSAFRAAKKALGIKSPSRLFADEIGEYIPPGITVGIKKAMPRAEDAVQDDMQEFAQKAQDAVLEAQSVPAQRTAADGNSRHAADPQNSGTSKVVVQGETHVHVDVDGREAARAIAPFMGEQMEFEEA